MRKFNKREKEFLKILEEISNIDLEFFSFFLQNKYFTKGSDSALIVFPKNATALLYIEKSVFDDFKARKEKLKRFIEMLSLIEYLKQDRLINIIPNPQVHDSSMHIMYEAFDSPNQTKNNQDIVLNQDGTYLKFPDISKIYNSNNEIKFEAVELGKHIYDLIINNIMGLLFVSEELKDYARNNFKSVDDIRYRYGQIAIWFSISMALIFGVLGIHNPLETKKHESYKINEQQYDTMIEYKKELQGDVNKILNILKFESQTESIDDRATQKQCIDHKNEN